MPGRVYPRVASTNDRIKSRRHRGRWWRRRWFPRRRSRRLGLRFHSETTKQGDDALLLLLSPPPENISLSLFFTRTQNAGSKEISRKQEEDDDDVFRSLLFSLSSSFTRQISGSARASLSLKCALQSNKACKGKTCERFWTFFLKTLNILRHIFTSATNP